MTNSTFGKMVKKRLIDLDMNQRQLAAIVGTSPRYMGFIITGDRSPGKYEQAILSALDLNQADAAS